MKVHNPVSTHILRRRCLTWRDLKEATLLLQSPLPPKHPVGQNAGRKSKTFLSYNGLRRTRVHSTRPGPTALEKQNGINVRQRGCMRKQDQTHLASGKSNPRPPTDVGTALQAKASWPTSSTAMNRLRFQHGVHPVVKQSREP